MYKNFFDFKERPFKLVPNPAYLFLSKCHEEALAHLSYAMGQGDGFVEITGEVGTGKTTLCRVFLENLKEDTEAAYIFNPKLDSIQLLKAINDEFQINSHSNNTKDLIDTLNLFLIEKKTQGKKVILVIDEAQNLTKDVLEQLRLLSNLETATSKLLQIIMVGQPELGDMLDSYELRQLGQRITLSCHITPMTYKETGEYIRHRIGIASKKPSVKFTISGLRAIYKYSRGVPRLINIACDRALLTAFVTGQRKISGKIARDAIDELLGRRDLKRRIIKRGAVPVLVASALSVALIMMFFGNFSKGQFKGLFNKAVNIQTPVTHDEEPFQVDAPQKTAFHPITVQEDKKFQTDSTSEQKLSETATENEKNIELQIPGPATADDNNIELQTLETAGPDEIKSDENKLGPETFEIAKLDDNNLEPEILKAVETDDNNLESKASNIVSNREHVEDLGEFLGNLEVVSTRETALNAATKLWNSKFETNHFLDNVVDDYTFFKLMAKQNGFFIYRVNDDFDLVKSLNLPAILELYQPGEQSPLYFTIVKIANSRIVLRSCEKWGEIEISQDEFKSYWSGVAYIPWRNHLALTGNIPTDAPKYSVIALKMLLNDIGFNDVKINSFYDEKTIESVKEVQKRHGIAVDGIVGPLTKIVLYNEKKSLAIPHLTG